MACDFAFYVGASRANIAELGKLERLPGCCGVKTFMGSSTGDLLVEDDDSVERILRHVSRRASFHSEDEDRLIARATLRVAGAISRSSSSEWNEARRLTWRNIRSTESSSSTSRSPVDDPMNVLTPQQPGSRSSLPSSAILARLAPT